MQVKSFFQNNDNMSLFINKKMVKRSKSTLIPGSGVNVEKFKPQSKIKSDDVIRFLYISRIMWEKGIDEYLQAAQTIVKQHKNVEFMILDPIEDKSNIDKFNNLEYERIKYLGKSDDVRNEIRDADCIVHLTYYHEGMSNVLLEGGAMGKPLIASNIPGCKEIIENGINGFLFEPRNVGDLIDKINIFLNLSKEEMHIMGNNSRKKIVNTFDRNIIVNYYINIIDNIIN